MNDDTLLKGIIRDSAMVVAAFTAVAYVLGYSHLYMYWRFLGLNRAIRPDATIEEVLLRGGITTFLLCFITFVGWRFRDAPPHKSSQAQTHLLFRQKHTLMLKILLVLVVAQLLNMGGAWVRSRQFRKEMILIQQLTLSPGNTISNPEELAFLGSMGSSLIFKRVMGKNLGSIVVIPTSEIRAVIMK